jgi:di/tricarboxylate transporter
VTAGPATVAASVPDWHLWLTAAAMVGVMAALVLGVAADLAMLTALVLLLATGVLTASQATSGFANEGLLTVAALYVVAAGLQGTGVVRLVAGGMLRPAPNARAAIMRMCPPIAAFSAFLNNTPIVAFMIPVVQDWARKSRIAPSKLLIPLSYATILGGTVTLIGTSTNLVVAGLVQGMLGSAENAVQGLRALTFFEPLPVGLPLVVVGLAYIALAGPRLLPARQPVLSTDEDDARRYTLAGQVASGGALDGRTIEQAGLRHMVGLFVVEVVRGNDSIPAPAPTQVLRGGDLVVFAGVVESVAELRQVRGLELRDETESGGAQARTARNSHRLVEAVVSDTFPGLGQTIREFGFRRRYDAAVVAVARNGERVPGRIGDVELKPGDTLLLEADPGFVERNRNSRDFYLVGALAGDAGTPAHSRAWIAGLILLGMVVVATWQGTMLVPAFVAAGLMLLFRCVTVPDARASLDLPTLLVIAASLGISRAIEGTGLGAHIGGAVVQAAGNHPTAALAAVYGATMLFTSFASNNAAAAIMFPIALGTAASVGGDPMPFVMAVLFAASADFATPIGYQTNLMVAGPGGYRFTDYLRIGLPLNMLAWVTTVLMLGLWYEVGAPAQP